MISINYENETASQQTLCSAERRGALTAWRRNIANVMKGRRGLGAAERKLALSSENVVARKLKKTHVSA